MAQSLPIHKSISGLLTLVFTLGAVVPGGFFLDTPNAFATTLTVSNTNDAGAGSLRQAITDANANAGVDTITFSTNGTLNVLSDLPAITEGVIIDGSSQNPVFNVNAAGRTYGLSVTSGDGTQIYGLSIQSAPDCLKVSGTATNTVIGNTAGSGAVNVNSCTSSGININGVTGVTIKNTYLGATVGNNIGILVGGNASNVLIGGTTSAERNVIQSSTAAGISISNCSNVTIKGNYIGVDKNGNTAANGTAGISIGTGCNGTIVGGTTAGERNVISGNGQQGIDINSDSTVVKGNYIGLDPTGANARANGQAGIKIQSSSNTIGGTTAGEINIISGNSGAGIRFDGTTRNVNSNIVVGNLIGVRSDGAALANSVGGILLSGGTMNNNQIGGNTAGSGNNISGNTGYGITNNGATNLSINGNYIGLGPDGNTPTANTSGGIYLQAGTATVGTTGCGACVNVIDANNGYGIRIDSNSNQVNNNWFGFNKDGITASNLTNNLHAISLQGTAASNLIAANVTGAGNKINFKTGQFAISSAGGSLNNFRGNTYYTTTIGTVLADRQGTSNDSIATPTISSAIRTSSSTVVVTGVAAALSTIDAYFDQGGNGTATADAIGNYSITVTNTGGQTVTVFSTNAGGSTSATPAIVAVVNDSTAPATPIINYPTEGIAGTAVTISGYGTEIGARVELNGVDTGVTVGSNGGFSVNATLVQGTNVITVGIADGMNNKATAVANILGIAGGSNTAGGGGTGGSFNVSINHSEDPIDTSNIDETPESMAGDEEVVDETQVKDETTAEVSSTEETASTDQNTSNDTTTSTTSTSSSTTNTSSESSTTVKTTPQKSFYSGIYSYVKPAVKPLSIRDTMPFRPTFRPIFAPSLFQTSAFKGKFIGGFPAKIIKIKLGSEDADLNGDDDNDGLTNGEELTYGSDPQLKDGDGDGLGDYVEIIEGTNPSSPDSDRDFIPDVLDPEPLVYNNPKEDVKPSTITDYIATYGLTDPAGVVDSDADALADEVELYMGTDPQDADTDDDGVDDGEEYLYRGTDPNNGTSAGMTGIYLNADPNETVAQGEQFFLGSAAANSTVGIYEVTDAPELVLLGQSEADDTGRFNVYTEDVLKPGSHTIVAIQGDAENIEDISSTYTLNVLEWIKRPEYVSLALKNGDYITETQPVVDLQTMANYMVIVSFNSTIYSQVLIADADNQVVYAKPAEDLELGEHTVTWYAQDLETNRKSNPTRVSFNITNEAFVNGQSGNSPWMLILGSIAVLASMAAIGLYFRKNKNVPPSSRG